MLKTKHNCSRCSFYGSFLNRERSESSFIGDRSTNKCPQTNARSEFSSVKPFNLYNDFPSSTFLSLQSFEYYHVMKKICQLGHEQMDSCLSTNLNVYDDFQIDGK